MWSCKEANTMDKKVYPNSNDVKTMCSATDNMEFTTCESVEPTTCKVSIYYTNCKSHKNYQCVLFVCFYLEYALHGACKRFSLSPWLSMQVGVRSGYQTKEMRPTNGMSLPSRWAELRRKCYRSK